MGSEMEMRRGINYDVGTNTRGKASSSRKEFDLTVVRKELEIIRNDLKCDSVRISGQDIGRLVQASESALQLGLEVVFSAYVEATEKEMMAYLKECAVAAEKLRNISPNIVFVAGCELTFFMKGLVDGKTSFDRMGTFMKPWRFLVEEHPGQGFIQSAAQPFPFRSGPRYQAGLPWPDHLCLGPLGKGGLVALRPGGDRLLSARREQEETRTGKGSEGTRRAANRSRSRSSAAARTRCRGQGRLRMGHMDRSKDPPRLNGRFVRDEEAQSRYGARLLQIFEEEGSTAPSFSRSSVPLTRTAMTRCSIFDMASYSIVKTYSDRQGTAYPGLPWDPKRSFASLGEHYGRH